MNMLKNLLLPDILEFIENKQFKELKQILSDIDIPNLVEIIEDLDDKDKILIFRMIPKEKANELFSELDLEVQMNLLSKLTDQQIKEILLELEPDDRTNIFEELPGKILQKYLNFLPKEERKEALELLGYPEDSIGRLMTPNYVAIRPNWTVERSLQHIRERGEKSETVNMIYITDEKWHFLDTIELKKLILSNPKTIIQEMMDNNFITLSPFDDKEKAVQLMRHYNLSALPVVDSENILVGIITFDDVMDVAEEEATEDFHKTAAISPIDESFLSTSIFTLFSKRILWLLGLVFINIFSGAIISSFENVIIAVVSLVFFMPLLNDSSGNVGSQASTLLIRHIAINSLNKGDELLILFKDFIVSFFLGLTMGLLVYILGLFRGGNNIGLTVALSMFIIVIISSLLGTILPMLLKFFKLDPATASSPLITTISDIISVSIYFSIAKLILKI